MQTGQSYQLIYRNSFVSALPSRDPQMHKQRREIINSSPSVAGKATLHLLTSSHWCNLSMVYVFRDYLCVRFPSMECLRNKELL